MHPLIVDIVDLALIIAKEGEHKMLVKAKNYNDMTWHLSYISASVHSFVIFCTWQRFLFSTIYCRQR